MENESDFYCAEVLSEKTKVEKVIETENVLAFYHTRPFYETHLVVIPKRHIASLLTLEKPDDEVFLEMLAVIKTIAARVVSEKGAARVLTNLGKYQESKHLHFHVVSGEQVRPDNKV